MNILSRRTVIRATLASALLYAASFNPAFAEDQTVSVLYAGSLVNAMERSIGPAFTQATGIAFEGYAAGSNKIANEIKGQLRRGDVFISASPKVNASLIGAANGNWVSWYLNFAESPLVIGYNPDSSYAKAIRTQRWDRALAMQGIRIGRTDPKLDPKGQFTVALVQHAAALYKKPDLEQQILGSGDNPEQVLPEETLVGRLQSGQLDAGFFYSTETTDLKIPAVALPDELKEKAQYTLTILNRAAHPDAAARFVDFLLSTQGQALLKARGIDIVAPTVVGDAAALPSSVKAQLDSTK